MKMTRRAPRNRVSFFVVLALVCGGLTVTSVIWSGTAGATAVPPFNQCPGVGASPSCEILIVVNADRSVTVLGDPSIGPYDGGDDTLIGVQNDSSTPVAAITVNGPGSGLSGFDGDGLCSPFYNPPSGCPFGTTGYEGPGTSLVTDPTLPDSAEVDFAGAGLGATSSTYFSLEGALTSAQLTVHQGHLKGVGRYVALGDSFSSGEGAIDTSGDPSFTPDSNYSQDQCHRSLNAYPELLSTEPAVNADPLEFDACSGAHVAEFVKSFPQDGQWSEGPQLDHIATANSPDANTGLVTLSLGGNDAGFVADLQACVHGFLRGFSGCTSQITNRLNSAVTLFTKGGRVKFANLSNLDNWSFCSGCPLGRSVVDVPTLAQLYQQIQQRAPNAEILVMGYPELFPDHASATCMVGVFENVFGVHFAYQLNPSEMDAMDSAEVKLNLTIQGQVNAAAANGVHVKFVDTYNAFAGHGPCDTTPPAAEWVNGLMWSGSFLKDVSVFSFHPNAAGQAEFEHLMLAAL